MKASGLYCYNCKTFIYSRARHDMVACYCRDKNKAKSVCVDGGQFDYFKTTKGLDSKSIFLRIDIPITKNEMIDDWKFNENNFGRLKIENINKEILKNIGGIPKEDLINEQNYIGICRNSYVAKWNSEESKFYYIRSKFGKFFIETINHPEDDDGFDLFIPLKKSKSPKDILPKDMWGISSNIFKKVEENEEE